jgi:hypothetical protein
MQSRSIMPSLWISKLARWWPWSALLTTLKVVPRVQLYIHLIPALECIPELTLASSPCLHNYSLPVHPQARLITTLECIPKFTQSRPPSVSTNILDYGLHVDMMIASKSISRFTQMRHPCVLVITLGCDLQAHLELLQSTACSVSHYSLCSLVAI